MEGVRIKILGRDTLNISNWQNNTSKTKTG